MAPGGATQVKTVRFAPLKVVASGLGDDPIDLMGAGAPSGVVNVIMNAKSGQSHVALCTDFAGCTYGLIGGGTGAKLKCKNGAPASVCAPIP
jgi:hypothetical protein